MLISNVSTDVSPCWLIQSDNCTLLLDCQISYNPLYESHFIGKKSPPRFQIPNLDKVIDLNGIDAILISNYHTFTALPWITERADEWNGSIYCTKPTLEFARIYLTQLRKYCDEEENMYKSKTMKDTRYKGMNTHMMVSQSQIESCLSRVQLINYGESLSIYGAAMVTPQSSGFSIGSCIWIIEINQKKIVYSNDYTNLRTHCAKTDTLLLKNADLMILSGLKFSDQFSPDKSVHEIGQTLVQTLKNQENIMFPVYPSGIIFDLLEIVMDHLERERIGAVPLYYIAPLAKNALAHAQIYPEFLSLQKQTRAANPEFPFLHEEALETGRLKIFEHASEGLSEHFKGPAVIFTGHPSLEMGQAKDWSTKWLKLKKHKIIIAEPDLPHSLFLDRRQTVSYLPIDTRLTQGSARLLIDDLQPKEVIISHKLNQQCPKLSEISSVKLTSILPYKTYESDIDHNLSVFVNIDPKVASQMKLQTLNEPEVQLCQISGLLRVINNRYELVEARNENRANVRQTLIGTLPCHQLLIQNLNAVGFKDLDIEKSKIRVPGGSIQFSLSETCVHHSDRTLREKMLTAVKNSLVL